MRHSGPACPGSGDADGISVTLQKMTRSLAHRGPDAEGYWTEGAVALGHRRLSILDLSDAGAQPMRSESGRLSHRIQWRDLQPPRYAS